MKPIAPPATRVDSADGSNEEDALAAVGERLRAERDGAMRGAHRHGVPIAAIARMMKMSFQRASHIIDA